MKMARQQRQGHGVLFQHLSVQVEQESYPRGVAMGEEALDRHGETDQQQVTITVPNYSKHLLAAYQFQLICCNTPSYYVVPQRRTTLMS